MPTGIEMDTFRATLKIARELERIADSLERLVRAADAAIGLYEDRPSTNQQ